MTPYYRVGRGHLREMRRAIYRQKHDQASKQDEFIGVMDTPELARLVVTALNEHFDKPLPERDRYWQPSEVQP